MKLPADHEAFKAFDRADDALKTAKYDLQGDFIFATVNRTYYCCYYCMSAALYTKDIYAKTHKGTMAKFSEIFIKTKIFPEESADTISKLFDNRQMADYDLDTAISAAEAEMLIYKAEELFLLTRKYLDNM